MSKSDNICSDGAVCEVNAMLQNMSTADKEEDIVLICANCGKEGDDINNICNKCKLVKYCNAACKKKHRHKHKKECGEHLRLAAERAAELHDEKLFKQPPPAYGDCPICFIQLPRLESGSTYQTCCGKIICSGCSYASVYDNQGNKVDSKTCPFCRTPKPKSNEEAVERVKRRMEVGDPYATYDLGCSYQDGVYGLPQDYKKALELFHRAGELGHAFAYNNIGYAYNHGKGVEFDKKKAQHYYELAAMVGNVEARHNLGIGEENTGNIDRAIKHYIIAVAGGFSESLKVIHELYSDGHATKEDYTKALQSYQAYLGEIKSKQRDEAAAADEDYRYF